MCIYVHVCRHVYLHMCASVCVHNACIFSPSCAYLECVVRACGQIMVVCQEYCFKWSLTCTYVLC